MITEAPGTVRVARQVLHTIISSVALEIPGVVRMARGPDSWPRFPGRERPKDGVVLTIKDNTIAADLYIVVASGVNIVEVGSAIQEEIAAAIEEMVGMHV